MANLDITKMNADEAAVFSIRKCGHFLHHSAGKDSTKTNEELMAALTEEEKKTLTELLQKCLASWNS